MKLRILVEDEREKAIRKAKIERHMQSLTPAQRSMIERVREHILKGKSQIKDDLAIGTISIGDIVYSIQNEKCIDSNDRDIGSTYLENVIGNAISDLFRGKHAGLARSAFGLKPIKPRNRHQGQSKPQPALGS